MIKIEERAAEKLSGLTSLFISFDYREDIVSWIKQNIELYSYNKRTKEWEVTILELAKILDSLCSLDNITLFRYNYREDKSSLLELQDDSLSFKLRPYAHQVEAINYGINHKKWLLLYDMGLGKSMSIIHIARYLKKYKGLKHCLIVCGINTLKANWKKEIKIHSDETYRVVGENINSKGNITYSTIPERAREIREGIEEFFIITNIESLRSKEVVQAINSRNDIGMIAVDEIHKISNKNSQQADGLLKLKAEYKIGATGTLITNSPLSSYTALKWLDIDKSNLTTFKREYCVFGGFGGHEIVGYKNLDLLKNEIDEYSLRKTKEEVLKDLPKKTVIDEYITMDDEHRVFYNKIKNAVKDEALKINLSKNNILSLTTRLRQATVCPSILTEEKVKSSKLERAVDLVHQIISEGSKVVVFSTYKEPVYQLKEMLKEYKCLIGTGDMKDEEVSKNIDLFQTSDKYKIFIGTTSKCGTGITLNAASYMIMLDTPFTAAATAQAEDRIYRIGTVKPVFIYHLICENTIDERVAKIIAKKEAFSDYLIDDSVSDASLKVLKNYILDL